MKWINKHFIAILALALLIIFISPECVITRISAASTFVLVIVTAYYVQHSGRQTNMAEQANLLAIKPKVIVIDPVVANTWPATDRYPFQITVKLENRGNGIARLNRFNLRNEEVSYDITYKPLYLIQGQRDRVVFDMVQTNGLLSDLRQAKDISLAVYYTDELNNPYKSEATISIYFSVVGANNPHSLVLKEIVSIGEVVKKNG
ncbi:hypothetical protein [Dehalococcoides mccartyi]|uniref:Uncharacterized protein n=1 Tax=Dehalococcoides mccartyi TaxID=61435 RepID=A0A142VAH5_9CHLR|nr:hypothetical protein [Dehalococcoides mccartyi]AGG07962.1 hypothetical protein btf_875 [Dehalococcoides mccartyi BTF08]AMU86659.1 hypothetical protein Dm11a5_0833 [Dehalococcoides mccartyi]